MLAVSAIIGVILGLILGLVALFIFGLVLRWLWNTTLPDVMGFKPITTFQAVKIMLIAALLFGGHRVIHYQSPAAFGATDQASGK